MKTLKVILAAAVLASAIPGIALAAGGSKNNCPVGFDGKPLITGPARCLEPFQKDIMGIGPPSGELAWHRRNANRLLSKQEPMRR